MGRMTLEQLKQKWGTESFRLLTTYLRNSREDGVDIREDGIDLILEMLGDVGEMLTEEVT